MHSTNIWAPWRLAYLRDLERRERDLRAAGQSDVSAANPDFFADYYSTPEADEANHVIHRDAHGLILLNRYPYANGHLLIALGAARPTLLDYTSDQRCAFWRLVDLAHALVHTALAPQGINMGINQGRAAGAGVPVHLHAHLVPRWGGDTNFLTVVGDIRVIPDALERMAETYRQALPAAQQMI